MTKSKAIINNSSDKIAFSLGGESQSASENLDSVELIAGCKRKTRNTVYRNERLSIEPILISRKKTGEKAISLLTKEPEIVETKIVPLPTTSHPVANSRLMANLETNRHAILHAFSFLSKEDLFSFAQTSKSAKSAAYDNYFWRVKTKEEIPHLGFRKGLTWKDNYIFIDKEKRLLEAHHLVKKECKKKIEYLGRLYSELAIKALSIPILEWAYKNRLINTANYSIPLIVNVMTAGNRKASQHKKLVYDGLFAFVVLSLYASSRISLPEAHFIALSERKLQRIDANDKIDLDTCLGVSLRIGVGISAKLPQLIRLIDKKLVDGLEEWGSKNTSSVFGALLTMHSASKLVNNLRDPAESWKSTNTLKSALDVVINLLFATEAFAGPELTLFLKSQLVLLFVVTAYYVDRLDQTVSLPGETLPDRIKRVITTPIPEEKTVIQIRPLENRVRLIDLPEFNPDRPSNYFEALAIVMSIYQLSLSYNSYASDPQGGVVHAAIAVLSTVYALPRLEVFLGRIVPFRNKDHDHTHLGRTCQKIVACSQALLATLRAPQFIAGCGLIATGAGFGVTPIGACLTFQGTRLILGDNVRTGEPRISFCTKVSRFAQEYLEKTYKWVKGLDPAQRLSVHYY